MLLYRVFQLRHSLVQTEKGSVEDKIESQLASWRNTAAGSTKRHGHRMILFLLRIWIKSRYFVKQKNQMLQSKLSTLFHSILGYKKGESKSQASSFLHSIAEYKATAKKMKEEIEKTEEQKNKETEERKPE